MVNVAFNIPVQFDGATRSVRNTQTQASIELIVPPGIHVLIFHLTTIQGEGYEAHFVGQGLHFTGILPREGIFSDADISSDGLRLTLADANLRGAEGLFTFNFELDFDGEIASPDPAIINEPPGGIDPEG